MNCWPIVLLCCVELCSALISSGQTGSSLLGRRSGGLLGQKSGGLLRRLVGRQSGRLGGQSGGLLGQQLAGLLRQRSGGSNLLRTLYATNADSAEFARMTALRNPALAGTVLLDQRTDINNLPSYRFAMTLDPQGNAYQSARQYVKLTGTVDSYGTERAMVRIFSRLVKSRDPTIQKLLMIDAIDGAYGDKVRSLAMVPGGFSMLKSMGPLALAALA